MSKTNPHPITKEDFEKLLEQAKEDRDKYWRPRKKEFYPTGKKTQEYIIAMCLGFGAGMRISEIYGLNKKQRYNYKLKDGEIVDRVKQHDIPELKFENFEYNTGFIYLSKRKKGKSGRVPIPNKLFRKAGITKETLKKYLPLKTSMRSCQNYFGSLCKRVLKQYSTFHQLRHGFVTTLLNNGMSIHKVQVFAGHSRIDTTGAYAHANPTEARDEYERIF